MDYEVLARVGGGRQGAGASEGEAFEYVGYVGDRRTMLPGTLTLGTERGVDLLASGEFIYRQLACQPSVASQTQCSKLNQCNNAQSMR